MVKTSNKRFKKKEKNKVKLKGQTLLPKGQNITNTSFKVKKIVIKEQLKEHLASDILSKKKLNLKELLSRLNHHNVGMRREALLGLKQVAEACTDDVLGRYLPSVLEAVANLTIDKEAEVRSDALKLLSAVLNQVSVNQMLPLFPILSSYLMCAMTHIEIPIREDSLKLLDMLLSNAPQLVASQADVLLPRFLDLISNSSSQGRSLSLHLGGKITAQKWRARVLYRLWKLLASVHSIKAGSGQGGKNEVSGNPKQLSYNENPELCFPIYSDIYFEPYSNGLTIGKLTSSELLANRTSKMKTQDYVERLVPLLLDMFAEVAPHRKTKDSSDNFNQHEISVEASVLLQCIVDIILLLCNIFKDTDDDSESSMKWFCNNYARRICKRLVENRFPYEMTQLRNSLETKKVKKEISALLSAVEGSQHADGLCLLQNMGLAQLFLLLNIKDAAVEPTRKRIVSYLKNCLRRCGTLSGEHCAMLKSCLEAVCNTEHESEARSLVGAVSSLFQQYRLLDRPFSQMLFDFLTRITLDNNLSHLHSVDAYMIWLTNLPELLTLPSIAYKTIRTISSISRRNIPAFSEGLDGFIESILDNVVSIKIEADNEDEINAGRRDIVSLLYWVKDWDQEVVSNLGKAVESGFLGPMLASHLIDILRLKITNDTESPLQDLLNAEDWWWKRQES